MKTDLKFTEQAIANAAAFSAQVKPWKFPAFLARKAAVTSVLVLAALATTGWLSIALYVLAGAGLAPLLFIGLGVSIVSERRARLDAMCVGCRSIAATKAVLFSQVGQR
ncbi:MAG: hypothetical protein ACRDTJ_32435 [Pseudonocardiaceae bacterium]